ncbi:type IV pilus assembly protein PilY1 [Variovorax boronicumulans]|uniref:pilus assembly protein n=1 Tax=Variovorax boronicumulans TaxID=436515 RepID=UPI0033913FC7
MTRKLLTTLWAAVLLALPIQAAQAEDIDLFVGYNPVAAQSPNVLFVLDNTANWNQPFTAEIAALSNAFASLKDARFKVGLMMFTETGQGNSNTDGGYVRAAVRTLDAPTKDKYSAMIRGLDKVGDKSNGGKAGKTMAEVYRYLSSGAPIAGNGKVKTDYAGNVSGTAASKAIYALPRNALASFNANAYVGPSTENCTGTFVIYISNGAAQDNNNDNQLSNEALRAAGGSTAQITLGTSGSQDNTADEWARFLQTNMGVKVYTIEAAKADQGQGPGWTALMQSVAKESKGEYYDITGKPELGAALGEALDDIFSKIQSVNSVFSSVSLPVSVNTQGTYLNQVFVGMFRPDQDAFPRWNGNLKQYKLGLDSSNQLVLQDAVGANAINNQTGFVAPCARAFWTPAPSTTDTYWSFRKSGDCIGKEAADSPDGNVVEKGAQGYMLRGILPDSRNMKTCAPGGCTALTAFNAGNTDITRAALGTADATEHAKLINWVRGLDNLGDERPNAQGNPVPSSAMRPSVHGDVVHSRPVAINYGTDAAPQVVVFYGGNDGVLRAINGNRNTAIGGAAAGSELWSFMPPEFYGSLKRLYDNSTRINFPELPVSMGAVAPKPYGMDGPVAAYRQGSNTWLYASMRRGGRLIYAFDVSSPATPTLKWRKGCPNQNDDTGCDTDFDGIGQTWSAPKVLRANGYGSANSPLLIFGGGYDKCEDVDTNSAAQACGSGVKGNRIYVLDADTGAQLKMFTTARPVVGEVTVVTDALGVAKIAYAADLGGNVYRISIGSAAPSAWGITKIASLGCDTVTTCTPNRKFMFAPDVLEDNGAYVVLLGSGDREKPLRYYNVALGVSNRFYMLVDKPTAGTWLTSEADRCGTGNEVLCHASLQAITTAENPTSTDLATKKGWYLALAAGEQVVTGSVTAYGTTTFNTHTPTAPNTQTCKADLGTARVYNVSYVDAAAQGTNGRFQNVVGGGLAPSPAVFRVQLDGNGGMRDVVIGANPDSFLSPKGTAPKAAFKQPKGRVYWFIQK